MANPNKVLQRLRAKQIKVLTQVGTNLARAIHKLAAEHLAGLSSDDVATVLGNSAVKKALGNIGAAKNSPVKAQGGKGTGAKRGRRSKVSDEQILEFLKNERSAGEIGKKLGQLIPKRVAGLVKDGKVTLRKDGLKKFYTAK